MGRKIEVMHNVFGAVEGHTCKECNHLMQYDWRDRRYYKCEIYGESNSEATDWRLKYIACGAFNREVPHRNVYKAKRPIVAQAELIKGQITIDDL